MIMTWWRLINPTKLMEWNDTHMMMMMMMTHVGGAWLVGWLLQ
jgi:hypothetical protein